MGKYVYCLQTQVESFKDCNNYVFSQFDSYYCFLSQERALIKTLGIQNRQASVFSGSLIQCLRNCSSHLIGRQWFYINEESKQSSLIKKKTKIIWTLLLLVFFTDCFSNRNWNQMKILHIESYLNLLKGSKIWILEQRSSFSNVTDMIMLLNSPWMIAQLH